MVQYAAKYRCRNATCSNFCTDMVGRVRRGRWLGRDSPNHADVAGGAGGDQLRNIEIKGGAIW